MCVNAGCVAVMLVSAYLEGLSTPDMSLLVVLVDVEVRGPSGRS